MEPLIRVKNMYKIYNPGENEVRALDDVSLEINQGEFIAIVGHSGSGKSTFMNMLGCLDTPDSGEYFLDGKDVANLSDNELSDIRNHKIGFIFQGFNLIPNLDALGNVELPLIYLRTWKATKKRDCRGSSIESWTGKSYGPQTEPAFRWTAAACRCSQSNCRTAADHPCR